MGKPKKKESFQSVNLPDVQEAIAVFRITGTAPLLVHNFWGKSVVQMLAKQADLTMEREKKNPVRDFEESKYFNVAGDECIPSVAIKNAMVSAAAYDKNLTKKDSRAGFYVRGEMLPVIFEKCVMRTDIVRTSGINRSPDIRFRAEYHGWHVDFVVEYDPTIISLDQLTYLLQRAGRSIGIHEWRPEKSGTHGTFAPEVLDADSLLVSKVTKACSSPRKPMELPTWLLQALNIDASEAMALVASPAAGGKKAKNGYSTAEAEE